MKILIANDQHWPMVSGPATVTRLLALSLAKRGHEVLVVAPSQTGKKYSDADENYRIVRTRSVPIPGRDNLRISTPFAAEIRGIIRGFGPDVVHVHTQAGVGLTVLNAASKLGIPIVATNHLMAINITANVRALRPFTKPIDYIMTEYGMLPYRRANHIIMPTQTAINLFNLQKVNVPVTPVSNGIDLSRFKPAKVPASLYKKFNIPRDRKIVAYLGRLDAEKHLSIILDAAPLVLSSIPDAHFLFVGHGNLNEGLVEQATRLGIRDRVTLTGRVSDEDIEKLHRVGSLYVMPSPAELQSISTLEAMASGQPIVAADAGALAELCHDGKNGYLFRLDDYEELAQKIVRILHDDKLRAQFSAESVRIAKKHDIKNALDQFEEVYRETIARVKLEQKVADDDARAE